MDNVCIKPILLRKGSTKVALYGNLVIRTFEHFMVALGLGNVRDERLNRMWTKQKVTFLRPTEDEGQDKHFNILVLVT